MKLTPVEAQVNGELIAELRDRKCHTCNARVDVGGWEDFFCSKGESVTRVMSGNGTCKKWRLDDNRENWRGEHG